MTLPPDTPATLAEELGLELTWAWQAASGAASPICGLLSAREAIIAGRASVVACVAGDSLTPEDHRALIRRFHQVFENWLDPLGFGGPNGIFALVQRRHMHEYGTTREQLACVPIRQRENALVHGGALINRPLTMEEYLGAPSVVEPLGLFDCVLPCAGAEAVLVVDAAAVELNRPPIEIAAGGESHNELRGELAPLQYGWHLFADRLLRDAGMTRDELDVLELYDDYPISVAIQLEEFGFCPRGESGHFLLETDTRWSGSLPINTGGGQLALGQAGAAGGLLGVVEAVQQLAGEAAGRQCGAAQVALATGLGMVSYGRALSCSAVLIRRGNFL